MKVVEPGTKMKAIRRTRQGISEKYIPEGRVGTLVQHYKSDYNGVWYYLVNWGRDLGGESQHPIEDLRRLPKARARVKAKQEGN